MPRPTDPTADHDWRNDQEYIKRRRAELAESREQRGGPRLGSWHTALPDHPGKAYCGVLCSENTFGFSYRWPDADDPFLDFHCPECRQRKPVKQLSLFGD